MSNIKIINNIGKEINVTVNGDKNKIEIVVDLAKQDFKLPKNLKPGDTFKDNDGDEYIFLYFDTSNEKVAILRKDNLSKMKFSESNNNYDGSNVDKYLCNTYLPELEKKFGKENIVEHEVDLLSLDGENDYGKIIRKVSIPTLDVYRQNKKSIKDSINRTFWLATPNSTPLGYGSDGVRFVRSGGDVGYYWCYYVCGVRPFFFLKSSIFES